VSFLGIHYMVGAGELRTHAELIDEAQSGALLLTLTGQLRSGVNENVAQPLIAPIGAQCGTGDGPTGDPSLPGGSTFQIEAAHVAAGDQVFLNGRPTPATLALLGTSSSCLPTQGQITTQLVEISGLSPAGAGPDLLQIRSTSGLLSNELPLP
jgi:hypothetical protein